ncbi:TetR/AcrR family transcriptional regulator [Streptomyces marincola]|uniref:TetR family transcriptional regulator n=1 Tax=Streptomyces marincola TaxID=2878388 RepID=A0A1W7CUI6_9ACTN|nr:TetR/AcrR family transcriptional regulator [Streptomyces marincola]ARQ68461.1 TetR family transcriptional regulator [Streptomyces marincola]
MATRARDRLLEAAEELFYAEGIHAVGVERLLSVSGVGRASFYRHFASKDDLVVAVLQRRDRLWRAWLEDSVAAHGGGPLAVFDALAEGAEDPGFHGCAFINAMAETADPDSEIYRLAGEHKQRVTDLLARLLSAAGHRDSDTRAGQLALLMDGAIVTAMRERSGEPARRARRMAEQLLS